MEVVDIMVVIILTTSPTDTDHILVIGMDGMDIDGGTLTRIGQVIHGVTTGTETGVGTE